MPIHARVVEPPAPGPHPPLVLVHGIAVSSRYMVPAARRLGRRFRVLAPDLPGFGESAKPRRVLGVGELADALAGWTSAAELPPAVLVGNSFGCQVAVRCAVRHPRRVAGVVLVGPTIDPAAPEAWRQIGRWLANAALEPPSLWRVVAGDALASGLVRTAGTFRHALRDPVERWLVEVEVPALVIRGARDRIAPQRWVEEATALLRDASLVVVPGAPHAVNWSAPEALARAITPFVEARATR